MMVENVFVAFEMVSPELAEYLANMDVYERELMVHEHYTDKVLGC